jgi:hypothetical protein
MSEIKHSDVITNERTIQRRDWIESALESVRARLRPIAEIGSVDSTDKKKPALYVAYSNTDKQKTGT